MLVVAVLTATVCIYGENKFAITGGVVSGTSQWNTSPPSSCIFQPDGTNRWVLDFTVDTSKNGFKFLKKDNGQPDTDWGWSSEIINIYSGTNISGGGGVNMQLLNFNNGDAVRMTLIYDSGADKYTINAVKLGLSISSSTPNPVNKGSTVTLKAEGAESVCSWEYLIDGGSTWLPFPDSPSGTLSERITVTVTEDTQFRVTSNGKQAKYEVVINNMVYAVTGGVVSGTPPWSTTPSESCIFTKDGENRWILKFIYEQSDFKLLGKNSGRAGEDWTWGSELVNVDNGANVLGCCGENMSLQNFSRGDAVKLILTKKNDGRYLLSAEAGNIFKIVPSLPNPIVQGAPLILTVDYVDAPCTWAYSFDGVTWSPYTGEVSGDLNETITPTPIVGTYYRATDGVSTDIYHVAVIIKCSGNSQTHLEETFGVLTSATARKRDNHVPSSYVYSAEGKEVHDGFYSVVANPIYCGRGDRTTPTDCHSESCIGNVNSDGDYWYVNRTDHTGNTNGGMLLLNCNNKGEVMYSYTQTGLCKNIYMTFSAWFASASSGIPIKTRFMVLDKNGNEILSARFDVDAISKDDGWIQGQTAFFSGDNETLTVQIVNNGSSGNGNDILVDDISFTSCIPKLDIRPSLDVICGDNSTLTVDSEGIEQIFGVAPYYLWQIFDDNAPNPDDPWVDIPDDTVEGRDSHGGSGWDKIYYDYLTEYKDVKPRFRAIMSADPNVAHQVGHGIFPICNVYAETDAATVDCGCAEQKIEHISGAENQTLCSGFNIEQVSYKASGTKTTGIGVINLPSEMTTDISGTNLTIKGATPFVEVETDKVIKVFAVGQAGVVCPSDTLELNLKLLPSPDAPNVKW